MKEDNVYKDLPQVIDVEVEPDIDFELREPEDEEGIEKDSQVEEMIEVEVVSEEEDAFAYDQEEMPYEETEYVEEKKKDTSFTTFKANQQAGEKKWRKNIWGRFKKFIFILLVLTLGVPLVGFGGFFAVLGVGMAIFICGAAFGMGVLGLGVSAFMTTAEIAGVGPLMFFMSLMGVGGGGLGLLLIWAILLGLKCLAVKIYRCIRNKMTQEVA